MSSEAHKNPAAPWLTALKVNQRLIVALIASSVVNVVLAVCIASMFPLKKIEPVFVEFQSGLNNFVRINAPGEEMRASQTLISYFLRLYIHDRETVDKTTETEIRYPRVMALSGAEVGANFRRVYGDKNTGLFFRPGFKRSLLISRDTSLGPGIHQVEFVTVDSVDGKPGEARTEWVATIGYEFSTQEVSFDDRLINPLGLFVSEYSLTRRVK